MQASGIQVSNSSSTGSGVVELTFEVRPVETFEIEHSREGSTLVLNWDSETGRTYQLQSRKSLIEADWGNNGDPTQGTGEQMSVTISSDGDASGFFRLVEE